MDTQTAISTLQTLSQNLGAQIGLLTTEQEAVNIAITQLQGTLVTEVTADQAKIDLLQTEVGGQPAPAQMPPALQ